MGSSKTTLALHAARRYQRLGEIVKLIRPSKSLRGHESPGKLITKNGESFPSTEVSNSTELRPYMDDMSFSVMWVDEPFLFDAENLLYDIVNNIRKTKTILISGIGSTSELEPFGSSMPKFLAASDEIIQCKADCDKCGGINKATRTVLLAPVHKLSQVLVGGTETFGAACPDCWTTLQSVDPRLRQDLLFKNARKTQT